MLVDVLEGGRGEKKREKKITKKGGGGGGGGRGERLGGWREEGVGVNWGTEGGGGTWQGKNRKGRCLSVPLIPSPSPTCIRHLTVQSFSFASLPLYIFTTLCTQLIAILSTLCTAPLSTLFTATYQHNLLQQQHVLLQHDNNELIIIAFKGAIPDCFQSRYSSANCLQHVR